jgi:hypothetical protein
MSAPRSALEDAIFCAEMAYEAERWPNEDFDGPDTLDEVAEAAWALLCLLGGSSDPKDLNEMRLISELMRTARPGEPTELSDLYDQLEEHLRFLDRLRGAARNAHQGDAKRIGRPRKNNDLRAAYSVLVEYWQKESEEIFTSGWGDTDQGLVPTSPAAQFLYETITKIDPERKNLAEELRTLMRETVAKLTGPRRGRPGRN